MTVCLCLHPNYRSPQSIGTQDESQIGVMRVQCSVGARNDTGPMLSANRTRVKKASSLWIRILFPHLTELAWRIETYDMLPESAEPAFWSSRLAQMHQASKTITYLTQVWYRQIQIRICPSRELKLDLNKPHAVVGLGRRVDYFFKKGKSVLVRKASGFHKRSSRRPRLNRRHGPGGRPIARHFKHSAARTTGPVTGGPPHFRGASRIHGG